jgi:hypothetical protein
LITFGGTAMPVAVFPTVKIVIRNVITSSVLRFWCTRAFALNEDARPRVVRLHRLLERGAGQGLSALAGGNRRHVSDHSLGSDDHAIRRAGHVRLAGRSAQDAAASARNTSGATMSAALSPTNAREAAAAVSLKKNPA